jgi:VWFA-related protein
VPRRSLRVLLLVLWAAVTVAAQEPAPKPGQETAPQPVFRAGVRAVRVDVSVSGKGDRPVTDLTPEDFTVEEDGVPQKVDTAQFVTLDGHRVGDTDSLPIRSQEHAEAEAARDDVRIFAIFLDDYHLDRQPFITVPMRKALLAFIDQLGPADLATVMDPLTPLSALRFTRDYEEIRSVIRKFEGRQGEIFPIKSDMEAEQLASRNPRMVRSEVTLSALAALATKLGNLREGRKSVLFVSQGPATMFGYDGNVEETMREVLEAASRGNVTISVFDPRGLAGEGVGVRATLYRLAGETGGREIVNTNGFDKGLTDIVSDASAYYLLGYTPSRQEDDGKFHKISVKVKRPGVDVLARKGYWAPKPGEVSAAAEVAATPATPGLTEALAPMVTSRAGRAVDVWIGESVDGEGKSRVQVTWEPAARGQADAAVPVALDVERVVDGKPVGAALEGITSSTGVQADGALASLELPPGDATLRFTARAKDGAPVDRWTQAVTVRDLSAEPLALGSPVVKRARSALELRMLRQTPTSAPTASRVFRRTDRVLIEIPCFGQQATAATLTVELLNKTGQPLVTMPVADQTSGRWQFELPVGSLVTSTYVLRLTATAGDTRVERLEAFEVVQ